MEKASIDRERAVVTDHQMAEVPQPGEGPLDYPTPFVAPKHAAVLWWCPTAVQAQRRDQHNASPSQPLSQCRLTTISLISEQTIGSGGKEGTKRHRARFLRSPRTGVRTRMSPCGSCITLDL